MKSLWIGFVLLLLSITCTSQYRKGYNSSLANIYDQLNYKSFASLEIEDSSGAMFNTSTLAGKTIYVDFWFTTCAPCLKELPYSDFLQQYFAADTNVVFLSICIENTERKTAWKQMIKDKAIKGVQLFYARNKPQKVNLLREYNITFPTYLIVNKEFKIIGYDAPRPSEEVWVRWAIVQAVENKLLSLAYKKMVTGSKDFKDFLWDSEQKIKLLRK